MLRRCQCFIGTFSPTSFKDGEDFRTHFQKVLGFSDSEFSKVRSAAIDLESKLRQSDESIKEDVATFRMSLPKPTFAADQPPLPPPQHLIDTFQARHEIVQEEIDVLRKSLNKVQILKFESFLQQDFSRSVTVTKAAPGRAHWPLTPSVSRKAVR